MRISDWSSDVCSSDLRTVDFTSGRYLADYSGKGELDATAIPEAERVPGYSYNWTPYGYFQDGAIGYKICDLPEANKPAVFAGCTRFGNSPALITPYQTLPSNRERCETIDNFTGGGHVAGRSEARSVGKECVCPCRSGWFDYH